MYNASRSLTERGECDIKLEDVNTTDILDAIRLACQAMCGVYYTDAGGAPLFRASAPPDGGLALSSVSHIPGRHLNGLLNAQDAAGIDIDEDCIEEHTRAALLSYNGAVPLPMSHRAEDAPPSHLTIHDIREGFHALYALVKYRGSRHARELAEASIAAIREYWDPEKGWDVARLEGTHAIQVDVSATFIHGLARAIGPLVKYYRATGYGPALELALALKDKAVADFFLEDGSYDIDRFGSHCHSTTCVMSSLAELGDLTSDGPLIARVKAFYDNGLWDIRNELGWSPESSKPVKYPEDTGEVNNSGDILETALILGRWGHTDYYHDAERILRGHILPSQLRDMAFVDRYDNPGHQLRGAFGFPAPYGHEPIGISTVKFNADIVGGTAASLSEAYRDIVRSDQSGIRVNLLFDHETQDVKVESPYTHGTLGVTVKRPGPLWVRIPPWVDRAALRVRGVDGKRAYANGYLFVSTPLVGRAVKVEFPMPRQDIVLTRPSRRIRARLRGDEVEAMESFDADLTFFDPLE